MSCLQARRVQARQVKVCVFFFHSFTTLATLSSRLKEVTDLHDSYVRDKSQFTALSYVQTLTYFLITYSCNMHLYIFTWNLRVINVYYYYLFLQDIMCFIIQRCQQQDCDLANLQRPYVCSGFLFGFDTFVNWCLFCLCGLFARHVISS